MKILRRVGIALVLLLAMVLAGMAYVAAGFDAAGVKKELARLVLEKNQRTLRIDGELSFSFWPVLGVRLGRVSLSERGSDQIFATLESARVSVRALPLLARQVVIDAIELSGVHAALLRRKDGTLNIDDLLAKNAGTAVKLDLAGLRIVDSRLSWRDELSGGDVALTSINLSTGHLANAAQGKLELGAKLVGSNPNVDSAIQLNAMYDYDIDGRRFDANRLDARIAGLLAGMPGVDLSLGADAIRIRPRDASVAGGLQLEALALRASGNVGDGGYAVTLAAPRLAFAAGKVSAATLRVSAKLAGAQRNIDASLVLSGIEGTPQALKVTKLALLLDAQAGAATLKGNLSSPCVADLVAQTMELPAFSGEFELANPQLPVQRMRLPISGRLRADFAKQLAEGTAGAQFDASKIKAKFNLAKFAPLEMGFAADVDRLNLDRYLLADQDRVMSIAAKGGEGKFDLSALKNLKLHGTVNIAILQFASAKARNVQLDLEAAGGKLEIGAADKSLPHSHAKMSDILINHQH